MNDFGHLNIRRQLLVLGCALVLGCGAPDSSQSGSSEGSASSFSQSGTSSSSQGGSSSSSQGSGGAGGSMLDGGGASAMCPPTLAATSRCAVQTDSIDCTHQIVTVMGRQVYWQSPLGTPPAQGWPAVLVFQGTGFGPSVTWSGSIGLPFGGFYQIKLQAMLLDNGFTVIAPAANTAWATNFPGYEQSADHALMLALFDALAAGMTFGPVDMNRVYATGISSGGYMTSRMAVTYPERCRALAIQSASYATCAGPVCNVPTMLPSNHPPTLFLHGQLDATVPILTAQAYYNELKAEGFETQMIIDPNAGHEWLDVAPEEITCWFMTH